ncbi:MAG: RidA family protein [Gorillibacterium sp.]|nr:RidA family protein [Gorillibacterium sp.]
MKLQPIHTELAPAAIGPYSQAMRVGELLFTSGQIALTPSGSITAVGIEAETRQVFKNLKAILEQAGATFSDVIKTTVFLQDMGEFAIVNAIYAECFGDHKPARSTVEVAKLPRDARVEIELIASLKGKI